MGLHVADSLNYEAIAKLAKTSVEDIAGKANDHLIFGYSAMANRYGQEFADKAVAESIAKFGIDGTNKIMDVGSNIGEAYSKTKRFVSSIIPNAEEKRPLFTEQLIQDYKGGGNLYKNYIKGEEKDVIGNYGERLQNAANTLTGKSSQEISDIVDSEIKSDFEAFVNNMDEARYKHKLLTPNQYFNTNNVQTNYNRRIVAGVAGGLTAGALINRRNNNRPY